MHRLVAVLVAATFVLPAPAAQAVKPPGGGGSGTLAWAISGSMQFDNPVEQQTDWPFESDPDGGVHNHTDNCVWDVDDNYTYLGFGHVDPGASARLVQCFISDPTSIWRTVNGQFAAWSMEHKYLAFRLSAPKPGLEVSVCYQPQGRCFTPQPQPVDSRWVYESCTQVAYADASDPAVHEIPGSNGGVGVETTITITVTNPTGQRVRDVRSASGPSWPGIGARIEGCVGAEPLIVRDYPYRYFVS